MQIDHDEAGWTVAVRADAGAGPVAVLDYGSAPKPFFRTVTTPSGVGMTEVAPEDHPWHRGLWFTVKYVDGINFWEEREPFGRQSVSDIRVSEPEPGLAAIDLGLDWHGPDGDGPVLTERRRWTVGVSGDATRIDLVTTLTATRPVALDRTPFTTWGGYGGLAFRGRAAWAPGRATLLGPDGAPVATGDRLLGDPGIAVDLSGPLTDALGEVGVAILDDPANPNHPTPWYTGSGAGNFLNAAFLFHGPMSLEEGVPLTLRYRTLIHDGAWGQPELERAAAGYTTNAVGEPSSIAGRNQR